MVTTSGAEALFQFTHISVREPCRTFSEMFTRVQAKRHQEIAQGNAMKGEIDAFDCHVDIGQNASQLYASSKGWHKRVAEWGCMSGLLISPVFRLFTAEKGRPANSACAGQNTAAPAFTQTSTAGKGQLWLSEGVAGQDLNGLRGTGCENHEQKESED